MEVLVTETLAPAGLAHLREHADVDVRTGLKAASSAASSASMTGWWCAAPPTSMRRWSAPAPNLKVIGRAGTGVDNIDVDAATDRGIIVVNAPTGNSNAVAEQTIAMVLALARRLYPAVASLKAGRWEKRSLAGHRGQGPGARLGRPRARGRHGGLKGQGARDGSCWPMTPTSRLAAPPPWASSWPSWMSCWPSPISSRCIVPSPPRPTA